MFQVINNKNTSRIYEKSHLNMISNNIIGCFVLKCLCVRLPDWRENSSIENKKNKI